MIADALFILFAVTLISVLTLVLGGIWFFMAMLLTEAYCMLFGKSRPQWIRRFD